MNWRSFMANLIATTAYICIWFVQLTLPIQKTKSYVQGLNKDVTTLLQPSWQLCHSVIQATCLWQGCTMCSQPFKTDSHNKYWSFTYNSNRCSYYISKYKLINNKQTCFLSPSEQTVSSCMCIHVHGCHTKVHNIWVIQNNHIILLDTLVCTTNNKFNS